MASKDAHDRTDRSTRVAAWIALVAAAAVVAALVLLLVRNIPALLAALASLLVAGAAGWIAITRRGLARRTGAVCAVAALIGGAVALIVLGALDELVVLALAAGAYAVACRRALAARAPVGAPAPDESVTRTGRPRRPVLLMNPRSGGGKVKRFDLVSEARRRGIEPIVLKQGDDLRALAQEAARSADAIGMAGGDGSQALVAQVAMEHDLPYVCVPAGHGTTSRSTWGSTATTSSAHSTPSPTVASTRSTSHSSTSGSSSTTSRSGSTPRSSSRRPTGTRSWGPVANDAPGPARPGRDPFDLRFQGPDGGERQTAQLVLVSNNPYVLDRLGGIGSRPGLDTGRLGIVAVEIDERRRGGEADVAQRARTALALRAAGSNGRHPSSRSHRVRRRSGDRRRGSRARPAAAIHHRPACPHRPACRPTSQAARLRPCSPASRAPQCATSGRSRSASTNRALRLRYSPARGRVGVAFESR